jgi:hypothetical protein
LLIGTQYFYRKILADFFNNIRTESGLSRDGDPASTSRRFRTFIRVSRVKGGDGSSSRTSASLKRERFADIVLERIPGREVFGFPSLIRTCKLMASI